MTLILRDYAYDDLGNPIAAAITAYTADTTSVQGTATAAAADGFWQILGLTDGLYDIKTVYGATVRWVKGKALHGGLCAARVHLNPGAQSIPNTGVNQTITWQAADYDRNVLFDAGAPTLLTIQTPGIYGIQAYVALAQPASSLGYTQLVVVHSNGPTNLCESLVPNQAGVITTLSCGMHAECASGETIKVQVNQNGFGAVNTNSGLLAVARLG